MLQNQRNWLPKATATNYDMNFCLNSLLTNYKIQDFSKIALLMLIAFCIIDTISWFIIRKNDKLDCVSTLQHVGLIKSFC